MCPRHLPGQAPTQGVFWAAGLPLMTATGCMSHDLKALGQSKLLLLNTLWCCEVLPILRRGHDHGMIVIRALIMDAHLLLAGLR